MIEFDYDLEAFNIEVGDLIRSSEAGSLSHVAYVNHIYTSNDQDINNVVVSIKWLTEPQDIIRIKFFDMKLYFEKKIWIQYKVH